MLDKEMIEFYHNNGKMPDRYYNQLNGKSAQENYNAFKQKQRAWLEQRRKQQAEAKEAEEAIAEQINEQLPEFISETLDDLFSGFKV